MIKKKSTVSGKYKDILKTLHIVRYIQRLFFYINSDKKLSFITGGKALNIVL